MPGDLISQSDECRAFFLHCMDQSIAAKGRVYAALAREAPSWSSISDGTSWAILSCVLSGSRKLRTTDAEGSDDSVTLRPGNMLFVNKGAPAWSRLDCGKSVDLTIKIKSDYTRFLCRGTLASTDQQPAPLYYNTSHTLPQAGRAVLEAIHALGETGQSTDAVPELCLALLKIARWELAHDVPGRIGKAVATFRALRAFVEENLQEPINRDTVARAFGLHPSHVSRLFCEHADRSFSRFLTDVRMSHAMELLRDPALSIKQISGQCGYAEPGYFIKVFRRAHGTTPGRLRSGG